MSDTKQLDAPHRGLSRRRFLYATGVALASPLLSAWSPRVEQSGGRKLVGPPLRLGALLPGSQLYPRLGASILAGLELGAEREGRAVTLVRAEHGAWPGAALAAAREMLGSGQVDGLVGVLNSAVSASLAPLLAETRTPLWVCEVGANAVSAVSPWITYHTLQYWQAQWLLGDWAARNLGRRAAIATSFYDSGYDTLFAFRQGFEAAGGTVLDTQVTHLDPRNPGLEEALAALARKQPDLVYGLYCGQAAREFVAAYARSPLAGRKPLAASAFVTAEDLLAAQGDAALGIITCLPWAADDANAERESLQGAFAVRTGASADLFAALGYDAGRLIVRATALFTGSVAQVRLAGPRGPVTVEAATRQTRAPLYIRSVQRVNGVLCNAAVAEVPLPSDLDARLEAARSGPRSGWTNTYLGV